MDPIRRLRVLAAAIPGSALTERLIPASFETVWAVASDLEDELAHFVIDVRSVQVLARHADRAVALVRGRSGLRGRFEVVLRPGWCLMQSRLVVGAMAAVDTPEGTRFALLGAFRIPAARVASPLLGAAGRALSTGVMRRFEHRVELRAVST